MKTSALGDHVRETTSIGKHLLLIRATDEIVGDQALVLTSWLLVSLISTAVARISLILSLSLDVDWRLRSNSIFGRR